MADASGAAPQETDKAESEGLPGSASSASAPASRDISPARRQGSVPLQNTLPTSRVGTLSFARVSARLKA